MYLISPLLNAQFNFVHSCERANNTKPFIEFWYLIVIRAGEILFTESIVNDRSLVPIYFSSFCLQLLGSHFAMSFQRKCSQVGKIVVYWFTPARTGWVIFMRRCKKGRYLSTAQQPSRHSTSQTKRIWKKIYSLDTKCQPCWFIVLRNWW